MRGFVNGVVMRNVNVIGVGMTKFTSLEAQRPYAEMAREAALDALKAAGVSSGEIGHAYCGWVYADSCAGQTALYQMGMSGISIFNVNNGCATGSNALYLARQAVGTGAVECALALGFEHIPLGAPEAAFNDHPAPMFKFFEKLWTFAPFAEGAAPADQLFGSAGLEYREKYGIKDETFAKISVKARRHAKYNERALFRDPLTVEEVLASPAQTPPLTRLQCCLPACGAAAALVCSDEFAANHGIKNRVRIVAQSMLTDFPSTCKGNSPMRIAGYDLTKNAAKAAYEEAGIGPEDIDVVELHDCFTSSELISYEALGLIPEGTAEKFIEDGDNTYGGKYVINPSGGLLSRGHPLGATGLAQCAELVWQLRGEAGFRQVEGARVALQHNIGLGSCVIVTIYGRN